MFRFWTSDARGDKTEEAQSTMSSPSKDTLTLATSPRSLKRKASLGDDDVKDAGVKRHRMEYSVATPPETPAVSTRQERQEYFSSHYSVSKLSPAADRIVDIINQQFGTEILLRHQELRFINQELAKCQAALEQLRRCHLIPYPTTCPTPQQMLDIVDGKLPAVQSKTGGPAPQWAPPYGVVDGPYARHYAKWLIPDPKFDGQIPEWQAMLAVSRNVVEGRSMRNNLPEGTTIGKRVARGQTGQKPPAGYAAATAPPTKTKGPCILKRGDGILVKLVCNECPPPRGPREDFSSTQGFINHCRISHHREYKSHEEAAVHCGEPIDVGEEKVTGPQVASETKATPVVQATPAAQSTGDVHPLARTDATTGQNAYVMVLQRIEASLKLFHQGRLPGVSRIPSTSSQTACNDVVRKPSKSFVGASATPFLSQLLQVRNFKGDLNAHVEDAKTEVDLDDLLSGEDDFDEGEQPLSSRVNESAKAKAPSTGARVPAMRIPARAVPSLPATTEQRPASSKGRSPHLSLVSTASKLTSTGDTTNDEDASSVDEANVMDIDRSPNTATSNNAPSLVSDDGGDDSDDASSSSDASDADAMSDIAEVNIEYPEMQDLAQHAGSTSNGARMKKDESRHVTFVNPVTGKAAARRKPRV